MKSTSDGIIEIFILSRNRPEFLKKALCSIEINSKNYTKIIVSDNSDSDDILNILKKDHKHIEFRSRRPCLSSNEHFKTVLNEAASEYVVLFHDDDEMLPGYIEKMYEIINNNIELSAVGCNANVLRGFKLTKDLFMHQRLSLRYLKSQHELVSEYLKNFTGGHAPFPSYMYRRSKILNIYLQIDEGGKHSDLTFLLKVLNNGSFAWTSEPLINYRVHGNNDSSTESICDRQNLIQYLKRSIGVKINKIDMLEYLTAFEYRKIKSKDSDNVKNIYKFKYYLIFLFYVAILLIVRPIAFKKIFHTMFLKG